MDRFMAFGAFMALVVVGCSGSSSSNGVTGTNPISSPGCQACLNNRCATQQTTCSASTVCVAFATCANPCTSQACTQACLQRNSDPSATGLGSCFDANCTSCLTAAATGSSGSNAVVTCDTCVTQSCSASVNACKADASCRADVTTCTSSACADVACLVTCAQGTGDNLAIAYIGCVSNSCSSPCNATTAGSGAMGSGSGASGGSSVGGVEPPGCLQSPPPDGTCPSGTAHDCPNGSPTGLTCTPAPSSTPGVPGPSGVYCCNK